MLLSGITVEISAGKYGVVGTCMGRLSCGIPMYTLAFIGRFAPSVWGKIVENLLFPPEVCGMVWHTTYLSGRFGVCVGKNSGEFTFPTGSSRNGVDFHFVWEISVENLLFPLEV